jgi:hypothetical protein
LSRDLDRDLETDRDSDLDPLDLEYEELLERDELLAVEMLLERAPWEGGTGMAAWGATLFFKCSLMSSVTPPMPILVK